MTRNLPEVDLVGLVLSELSRAGEHGLDGSTGQGVLPLDDEFVAVAADQLDVPRNAILVLEIYILYFVLKY